MMAENEMVGWHHRLDGHEFEQFLGLGLRVGLHLYKEIGQVRGPEQRLCDAY